MPVSAGIIDTALHPPLGLLTNHLDGNGPYTGDNMITTWLDGAVTKSVGNTFGVIAVAHGSIPVELGLLFGASMGGATLFTGDEYEVRLLQLVVQHQLLLGLGGWVTTQVIDSNALAVLVLWAEAIPGRLGIYTLPGMSFDLQFLLAL